MAVAAEQIEGAPGDELGAYLATVPRETAHAVRSFDRGLSATAWLERWKQGRAT
jgi:hypothetical protein